MKWWEWLLIVLGGIGLIWFLAAKYLNWAYKWTNDHNT
jgi:hypothetical protein